MSTKGPYLHVVIFLLKVLQYSKLHLMSWRLYVLVNRHRIYLLWDGRTIGVMYVNCSRTRISIQNDTLGLLLIPKNVIMKIEFAPTLHPHPSNCIFLLL